MKPEMRDFLEKYHEKDIVIALDFGIIHNIVSTMHTTITKRGLPEDARETLIYCQSCLLSQIIDQFPECRDIYIKDYRKIEEKLDEN